MKKLNMLSRNMTIDTCLQTIFHLLIRIATEGQRKKRADSIILSL